MDGKSLKPYLCFIHKHDEGRSGPHGISRSQLVSGADLYINLYKSNKTGCYPPGFLFGNFLESRFDEATRST